MPSKVRIIQRPNSKRWDELIIDAITRGAFGDEHEHDYFGINGQDRADSIRRHLRTAARHQGVGAKVFWKECPNPGKCETGGADCTHHVYYTLYDMETARKYKADQAAAAQQNRR